MKWMWWLLLIIIFGIFSVQAAVRLDPDFGWHLMTGNYVVQHRQIPKTDPFSYTMPSYPYVDHAWLSDVIWAIVYPKLGMTVLAGLYAAIVVLTVLVAVYPEYSLRSVLGLLLAAPMFLLRFSVRTQVVDWLLFAIFLRVLHWTSRLRYLALVTCIWFWANLHGGFIVGLAVWAMTAVVESWMKKRILWKDLLAWVTGLVVTLLTPYGFELWREVGMTLWGNQMRTYIIEWMPSVFNFEPAFIFAAVLLGFGYWYFRSRFSSWTGLLIGAIILEAILSTRHVALFAVLFLFLWPKVFAEFERLVAGNLARAKIFFGVLLGIAGLFFVWVCGWQLVSQLADPNRSRYYPIGAIEYLKEHPFEGNLLAEYGWGGYLIWQYPEKKVFIDGRMAIWKRDMAPEEESLSAFADIIDISEKGNFQPYFEKYKIQRVLWPKPGVKTSSLLNFPVPNMVLQFLNYKEPVQFLHTLEEAGWHNVYEDKTAIIYAAPSK